MIAALVFRHWQFRRSPPHELDDLKSLVLSKDVIPTAVKRARAFGYPFAPGFGANGRISVRVGRRDLALPNFLIPSAKNTRSLRSYSDADEIASSSTELGMTSFLAEQNPGAV